jgi:hypothetical protein
VLVSGAVLLTAKNRASWYDRPFIMGYAEDGLSLVIST